MDRTLGSRLSALGSRLSALLSAINVYAQTAVQRLRRLLQSGHAFGDYLRLTGGFIGDYPIRTIRSCLKVVVQIPFRRSAGILLRARHNRIVLSDLSSMKVRHLGLHMRARR